MWEPSRAVTRPEEKHSFLFSAHRHWGLNQKNPRYLSCLPWEAGALRLSQQRLWTGAEIPAAEEFSTTSAVVAPSAVKGRIVGERSFCGLEHSRNHPDHKTLQEPAPLVLTVQLQRGWVACSPDLSSGLRLWILVFPSSFQSSFPLDFKETTPGLNPSVFCLRLLVQSGHLVTSLSHSESQPESPTGLLVHIQRKERPSLCSHPICTGAQGLAHTPSFACVTRHSYAVHNLCNCT